MPRHIARLGIERRAVGTRRRSVIRGGTAVEWVAVRGRAHADIGTGSRTAGQNGDGRHGERGLVGHRLRVARTRLSRYGAWV